MVVLRPGAACLWLRSVDAGVARWGLLKKKGRSVTWKNGLHAEECIRESFSAWLANTSGPQPLGCFSALLLSVLAFSNALIVVAEERCRAAGTPAAVIAPTSSGR